VTGVARLPRGASAWSDGMYKRLMLFIVSALVLVLAGCAPFVSSGDQGEIVVYLGGSPGSRALSDPPFDELPVFSSFTIRVSGPGMAPVEFTADSSQSSFTAMVPGGSDRVVELYAPVDWDATNAMLAILHPVGIPAQPTLVKAYGATATVNVIPGQRVSAVLRLEVAETKILLTDVYFGTITSVSSMSGVPDTPTIYSNSGLFESTDFEFDRYGKLFINGNNVENYTNLGNSAPYDPIAFGATSLALDKQRNILYMMVNGGLIFADLSLNPIVTDSVIPPSEYYFSSKGLAVDSSGILYVDAYDNGDPPVKGILKFSSSNPNDYSFSSFQALGLEYYVDDGYGETYTISLDIRDMTIKDGKLYVLAGENYSGSTTHHGKLIEIDPDTMIKTRELGWTSSDSPTDPATQFYGPQRFLALVPRKLIFADEGYDGLNDIDRVIEVDLESWSISDIGLDNTGYSFFNLYAYGS
jgi:hypothetical protein